ncbi:MAG: group 1 truncated hemoglobin, partial [Deltaproteobacteria bacterium]|nr:group 1 truncated hemoglobin [Deltaproteobacteria bacterium]
MQAPSLYQQLGGGLALRAIVDRFVGSMFDDVMIGYLFRRADRRRVAEKEYELASQILGGPDTYSGRPLREAHAPHHIARGQFDRRVVLLREALAAGHAPAAVQSAWLAHTERLRAAILAGGDEACGPES